MAAAAQAACRPPVEKRAEVTQQSYIPTRRKRWSDLGEMLPERACAEAGSTFESEFVSTTSGEVSLYSSKIPGWESREGSGVRLCFRRLIPISTRVKWLELKGEGWIQTI